MRNRAYTASCLAFLLLLLASIGMRGAITGKHVYAEDFTRTQYKDVSATTAWWDTLQGELRLNLAMEQVGTCYVYEPDKIVPDGDYAYVIDFNYGLRVLDIRDPASPAVVASCPTTYDVYDFALRGSHIYAAVDEGGPGSLQGGLDVIDISNPLAPTKIAHLNIANTEPNGVSTFGDYALVGTGSGGIVTVDISNPASPTVCGTLATSGDVERSVVEGQYAYFANGSSLLVVDVSDPCSLHIEGTCALPGTKHYFVAVAGKYAFVNDWSSGGGVCIVDITDPANPAYLITIDNHKATRHIVVDGQYLYVGCGDNGIYVYDIRDPLNALEIGHFETTGAVIATALHGEELFISDRPGNFRVVDVADLTMPPRLCGMINLGSNSSRVTLAGDVAYVLSSNNVISSVSISNPCSPALLDSIPVGSSLGYHLDVEGDRAYYVQEDGSFRVIDVSDPSNMSVLSSIPTHDNALWVDVDGNYVYVACESGGVTVIDVSNSTLPVELANFDTIGSCQGIEVKDDHAFVANWNDGLMVLDVSDPTDPIFVTSLLTSGGAAGISLFGDYAFIGCQNPGCLDIVDIRNPASPSILGRLPLGTNVIHPVIRGDYCFINSVAGGFYVVDISDVTAPALVATVPVPGSVYSLAVSGDYAFMPDGPSGNLLTYKLFDHKLDTVNGVGQSLVLNTVDGEIVASRLRTSQSGIITWKVSADSGTTWEDIDPDWNWHEFTVKGRNILWQSRLEFPDSVYEAGNVFPVCSSVDLDWLYSAAVIDSIVDVPADEGGWVRLHIARSGYDADPSSKPIVGYNVYRKVEDGVLAMRITSEGKEIDESLLLASSQRQNKRDLPFAVGGARIISLDGRNFAAGAGLPEGTWEIVTSFYALQQDQYECLAPTRADLTSAGVPYATYVTSAHTTTPSVWFVSAPDSGYSVDNLPPAIPSAVAFKYPDAITWNDNTDADLAGYCVYADSFETGHPDSITTVAESEYDGIAALIERGYHFFRVTAVDRHGNESAYSSPVIPTGVDALTPLASSLEQNIPNPFNPTTKIAFSMGKQGHVSLRIYDTAGRLIDVLVDADVHAGNHTVEWHGRDRMNRGVASGVYFYRLETKDFVETKKMILLR
jgi:hypothetical protein